jgi:hypothetical protein
MGGIWSTHDEIKFVYLLAWDEDWSTHVEMHFVHLLAWSTQIKDTFSVFSIQGQIHFMSSLIWDRFGQHNLVYIL